MCWHKWVWEKPKKENWDYYETAWSTPLEFQKTVQYGTCSKCGKSKKRYI
jgi:hypothetical protein